MYFHVFSAYAFNHMQFPQKQKNGLVALGAMTVVVTPKVMLSDGTWSVYPMRCSKSFLMFSYSRGLTGLGQTLKN